MPDEHDADPASPEQPNVLVVLTDQQRWDTVGAYGSPMDLTPNLDAMADRGTRLDRTFTSQPVCGPCRASLQTGQYATENGVWCNAETIDADADGLLARAFNRAGYRTGYVGKWHLAGTGTDPVPAAQRAGYNDFWRAADLAEFTSHPYEGRVFDDDGDPVTFEDRYRVNAFTDMAVEGLDSLAGEEPFFLFVSYLEPHHQNDMETYVAPDGYAERHADPHVPRDLRDRPGDWYAELPDYYGICERIDEQFGRLLSELDERGLRDDTVVLFTSDHGSHFYTRPGEYKRSPHESSIRVPAVLSGPGFDGGGVVEDLVSLVDLPPTLLDAANVDVPASMQGESVIPLVSGERSDWKDEVFIQISESQIGRALRTDRFTYAVAAPAPDGWAGGMDEQSSDEYVERYLYDLRADPHQRVNLVDRPEYRDVRTDLRERLRDRMAAAGEDRPEIRPFAAPGHREY